MHGFAGRALAALDGVADAPAWAMTPREQAETLVELVQLASRVAELRWRVLAAADRNEIGAKDGSTSTAAWLARATRENRSKTNGDLRGARALDEQRFAVTRSAFAAGRLTEDQVWVIIRAVEDLPAGEVSEEQRVTAQEHLVMLAAEHDAKALRVLARRLFEVLAPTRRTGGRPRRWSGRSGGPGSGHGSRCATTATAPAAAGSSCPPCRRRCWARRCRRSPPPAGRTPVPGSTPRARSFPTRCSSVRRSRT